MNFTIERRFAAIINDTRVSFVGPIPEDFKTAGEPYYISCISMTAGGSVISSVYYDIPIKGDKDLHTASQAIFEGDHLESSEQLARWYAVRLRKQKNMEVSVNSNSGFLSVWRDRIKSCASRLGSSVI